MKMIIDGISYKVKEEWRFRITKKKVLVILAILALSSLTLAHADPAIWQTFASGGGASGSVAGMHTW